MVPVDLVKTTTLTDYNSKTYQLPMVPVDLVKTTTLIDYNTLKHTSYLWSLLI